MRGVDIFRLIRVLYLADIAQKNVICVTILHFCNGKSHSKFT
ncbi:hypothetical protein MADA3029_20028 [Vibrio nigripulchritudo MADA3029]|nr:hypothetical protein VIBNIAM115_1230034 [Vibrio nigripulchritudo AM115]CCN44729.1 hypothetical protein VIBNIFTn2_890034 [Vibrio nigripulchritudo FTn2]CCN45415.1 hypothetical protein VIBNIMADA3020_1060022 [Vibrio nigripulchritudo MADA3020]CCN58590.1 hypothetical protein MADA3029_20028 [Vibrio nigripulchritudo MADA3029]CCN63001.1 hypothetical protein VIBNIPon4_1070026 [Vibrio nigripulchritudo POn4]CCN73173.1 hypothetical protein VIBNISFn118_760066 [Vibrio nigripulchritudo SFn118]CCN75123.1 h